MFRVGRATAGCDIASKTTGNCWPYFFHSGSSHCYEWAGLWPLQLPISSKIYWIFFGFLADTPVRDCLWVWRKNLLKNAMSRDIQFVLHQRSKSPQLLGLGPTQRFKRSPCYLNALPRFESLTLISDPHLLTSPFWLISDPHWLTTRMWDKIVCWVKKSDMLACPDHCFGGLHLSF